MSAHPIKAEIARQVRVLRERTGLSQTAVAHDLGTSQSNVARWEKPDGHMPNLQSLLNLAEIYGVDLKIEFVEKSNGN